VTVATPAGPEAADEAPFGEAPVRPRRRVAVWVALAIGLLMALLVGVLATRPSAESTLARSPLLGKPAPDLDSPTLSGAHLRLVDLRGRWVLVNFFNSWCIPCRQEHPELVKFAERHKATGDAQLVGVIHDDQVPDVRSYLAAEGGDWPVVDDPRGAVALDYGVRGQPETFVIDPDGYVVSRIISATTADGLDHLLASAKARRA